MDGFIDIYCESGFLEKFLCAEKKKIWWNYFEDLFCAPSSIRITDIDSLDKFEGEILDMILKSKDNKQNGEIVCLKEERECMEITIREKYEDERYFSEKKHAIFLMDREKDECAKMEKDYGLLFISKYNFYEYSLLFSPDIQEINENSNLWKCAANYNLPCNSMLLVDNFIMEKDIKDIENNLHSLFEALLPKELRKTSFKIDVFTKKASDPSREEKNKKIIEDCIQKIERLYKIQVNINTQYNPNDHDRYLLTNYGLFMSGYGFVLTHSERKKGTSLSFFPITHCSVNKRNNAYQIIQTLHDRKQSK